MFKAIARMYDDKKQWDVIISTHKTREEAEKEAYRFFNRYSENTHTPWLTILWLQVLEV